MRARYEYANEWGAYLSLMMLFLMVIPETVTLESIEPWEKKWYVDAPGGTHCLADVQWRYRGRRCRCCPGR